MFWDGKNSDAFPVESGFRKKTLALTRFYLSLGSMGQIMKATPLAETNKYLLDKSM